MVSNPASLAICAALVALGAAGCWTMDASPSEPSGTEDKSDARGAGASSEPSSDAAEPSEDRGTPAARGVLSTRGAAVDTRVAAAKPESPSATQGDAAEAEAEAEEVTDADDDDEVWVGPPDHIEDCEGKLDAAGVTYAPSRIPLHKTKSGYMCGAEQAVRYEKGPGDIRWGGKPRVTCGVALALAGMETIVQEEAERHFGRPVQRISHMGTYNCREMANYPGWVSEHSYGNAIDIKEFKLKGGKTISVLADYAKTGTEAKTAKAKFLRAVARRLYDERVFSVVLTPSFDRAHRNHFHLDMARYSVDGI